MLPLPKWAMQRYATLWVEYGKNPFPYIDAKKTLGLNSNALSVTLNHLKKAGWIAVELNPDDSRKRTYRVIHPRKAVEKLGGGQ